MVRSGYGLKGAAHLVAVACLVLSACSQSVVRADKPSVPNIVVILADDMGYSDLGCYGGEIDTPNLDALAKDGLRFTEFYNTARCCPSRASLLTGLYPHRAEMGWMTAADMGRPGYSNELSADTRTISEALGHVGYATAMVGKWHVTNDASYKTGPNGSWPFERGFDRFYGTIAGAKDYYKPTMLYDDSEPVKDIPEDYYYTRAITERAVGFIHDAPEDKPLFLYVAFYAPHFPLQAPDTTIAKYKGLYDVGWDHHRAERIQRQKQLGIVPADTELSERDPSVPAWEELSDEKRADMIDRMTIYAAQVDELDQGVGRVVEALKASGRFENTLIMFMSDNGAVGLSLWGRGTHEQLNQTGHYTDYGRGWSNMSNTPYRLYKRYAHEGGVRTPLIVHWPGHIDDPGALRDDPGHIIDILPTSLAVAGNPDIRTDRATLIPDGISLLPAINGEGLDPDRPLFFEHEGHHGVRMGRWKLVALKAKSPWELYDLQTDRTEMHDLSAKHPGKVKELAKLWNDWAERCNVLPMDESGWSNRIKAAKKAGR